MDPLVRRQIEGTFRELVKVRACGQLNDKLYHKGLMKLVYEYVEAKSVPDAIGMMFYVDKRYLRNHMLYQMYEDQEFANQMFVVQRVFKENGYYWDGKVKNG